jgi:DNA adenine methylase
MEPMYKWVGGKAKEIKDFGSYIPNFKRYVEPFFGGGSLYFHLKPEQAILNDLNKEIVNFYDLIKAGQGSAIKAHIETNYANTEQDYYRVRSLVTTTPLESAARFFYLRKTSFRGIYRENKKGQFNVPYGNYKKMDLSCLTDEKYKDLLSNTVFLNGDFSLVFNNLNADDFVFLDPPYDETFSDYHSSGFGSTEHKKLADLFKQTPAKCMLIIKETEFINELYDGYIKASYGKKYSVTTGHKTIDDTKHLIITNF